MYRILAFGCHPDDIEFMAAGTLALLAQRGHEIHLATLAGGEVGSPTLTKQQIRSQRLQEAAASARVLNGDFHFAGGHDLEIEYSSEYRRKTVRVLRDVQPDIVLTCPPSDYLADHEITSQLVRNAAFIASVPLYDCGMPTVPMEKIPYLYYWDAVSGEDIFGRALPVHFGIDVSTVMDIKEQMLKCHESQAEWLRFINNWDQYTDNMRQQSRLTGERIGREWGECFIQHRGSGHPQDDIIRELLPDLYVPLEG